MPRGRQYYDPIEQAPGKVEGETDYSRIELFPAGPESLGRLPQDQGKWIGRRIAADGSIAEEAPGDFDHDNALRQAEQMWRGLTVYELNAENEDSTWDGTGPSPRIWQSGTVAGTLEYGDFTRHLVDIPNDLPPAVDESVQLRVLPLTKPGTYVLLDDIRSLLESWAAAYETDKNPSAALALRDAVDVLKDVG